jgi:hypothetical protein
VSVTKLQLFLKEIVHLGHIVDGTSIKMLPERKTQIRLMEVHSKQELQKFLVMANYVSNYIKDYHAKACILNSLLRKDKPFCLDANQRSMMEEIKQDIEDAPTLFLICPQLPIHVAVDSSYHAAGGMIFQEIDGRKSIINFWSLMSFWAQIKWS